MGHQKFCKKGGEEYTQICLYVHKIFLEGYFWIIRTSLGQHEQLHWIPFYTYWNFKPCECATYSKGKTVKV